MILKVGEANLLRKICRAVCSIVILAIKYIPFTPAMKLRNLCYRYVLKEMGNSNITDGVTIVHPGKVSIGDRVSIHPHTYLRGEITIGNYVAIAAKCSFVAESHNFADVTTPIKLQGIEDQPISIGNDVWIGAHSIILGNVTIGDGAIIGAGSVVTKNIAPYSVVMGSPARVVRNRKNNRDLQEKIDQ